MTLLAVLGAKALWLTYIWLLSAAGAAWLSNRKGYGERPGLATGLLLSAVGLLVWIFWPPRADSRWKLQGAFGRKAGGKTLAQARADQHAASDQEPPADQ